jgi:hypothetical protein
MLNLGESGARRALPVDIRGPVRGGTNFFAGGAHSAAPTPLSPDISEKGDGFQPTPTRFIHQHFIPLSSSRNNSLLFIVSAGLRG